MPPKMLNIGTYACYFTLQQVQILIDALVDLKMHEGDLYEGEEEILKYLRDKRDNIERTYNGHRAHRS